MEEYMGANKSNECCSLCKTGRRRRPAIRQRVRPVSAKHYFDSFSVCGLASCYPCSNGAPSPFPCPVICRKSSHTRTASPHTICGIETHESLLCHCQASSRNAPEVECQWALLRIRGTPAGTCTKPSLTVCAILGAARRCVHPADFGAMHAV